MINRWTAQINIKYILDINKEMYEIIKCMSVIADKSPTHAG